MNDLLSAISSGDETGAAEVARHLALQKFPIQLQVCESGSLSNPASDKRIKWVLFIFITVSQPTKPSDWQTAIQAVRLTDGYPCSQTDRRLSKQSDWQMANQAVRLTDAHPSSQTDRRPTKQSDWQTPIQAVRMTDAHPSSQTNRWPTKQSDWQTPIQAVKLTDGQLSTAN